MRYSNLKKRLGIILGGVVILATLGVIPNLLWPTLLPKAGATLPPRQTATPPSKNGNNDDDDGPQVELGAYIELQSSAALSGSWAWVEWQDSAGNWHKVDGWTGALDDQGHQRWFVAQKDFGDGPFRWVVSQGSGGAVVGTSAPFNLPTEAFQTVIVTIAQ